MKDVNLCGVKHKDKYAPQKQASLVSVYKFGQLRYACFLAKSETHLAPGETALLPSSHTSPIQLIYAQVA
jgi:hypothetical protein